MRSSKLLLGLLAGVAVAGLIGLLTTTKEGSKIRKTISRKGNRYAADLKDSFSKFLDSVSEKYSNLKEGSNDHYKSWENRSF